MDEKRAYENGAVPVERSGWTKPMGLATSYPALTGTVDTDVLVVGAGLAGASLALHLAEAGVQVCIVEARQPGWGASGRNAGHVLPILRDMSVFQRFSDKGARFLDVFRAHHTIPFDLAAKHGIDCDAARTGYLNGMRTEAARDAFLKDAAHLKTLRLQNVISLGPDDMAAKLGTRYYPYGAVYENGGRINPYLFTNGMLAAAVRHGATIYGQTEAIAVEKIKSGWRVRCAQGEVRAKRVVFCTGAYATQVIPEFASAFYPLTAFGITTKPLSKEALECIMPGGGTFAQVPVDLNPLVRDRHGRLILSSLPRVQHADDAHWHFQTQLLWLHKVWPESKRFGIEMQDYWTGRVAFRKIEFPGVFELQRGIYGLMHFNAWGNVMAPLLGMLLAKGVARDRMDELPFPVEKPEPVSFPNKQELIIRHLMIPAARTAQRLGLI